MACTTGILVFDDVEELDFVGPWEVFTSARKEGDEVVTISPDGKPVRAAKGLRTTPDHGFADAPALDVLVVPGGRGARERVGDHALLDWIRSTAAGCDWVTSVCTGALLLHATGLTNGKRITTHWAYIDQLRATGDVEVLDD